MSEYVVFNVQLELGTFLEQNILFYNRQTYTIEPLGLFANSIIKEVVTSRTVKHLVKVYVTVKLLSTGYFNIRT